MEPRIRRPSEGSARASADGCESGRTVVMKLMSAAFLALSAFALRAGEAEHPYILWTRSEAKQLRDRILSEPWAQEKFVARFQKVTNAWDRSTADNLFLYTMTGDRDAAQAEMTALLGFINAPPLVKDMTDWRWHHVDHYDMPIRFDVFYDALTAGQRKALVETFRKLAVFGIEEERLRGPESPRMLSHMFCALATGDKRLIRAIFECKGGMKEFFDGMKEGVFSPAGNNPSHRSIGEMWLWCRAVERLGMNDIGFGYTGAGDLRGYLEGIIELGDPKVDIPGGMPFYGRSALGVTFSPGSFHRIPMEGYPSEMFRAPIALGSLRSGGGGWGDWHNTTTSKAYDAYEQGSFRMQLSLVFELAHMRWPDAGFGWFLTRMRGSGLDKYIPSIYWGSGPIAVADVRPPAVKSAIHPSVGVALMRAEEGPSYWESPAPYAVMRLIGPLPAESVKTPQGHAGVARLMRLLAPPSDVYRGTALALLSLHAFNRPLYRSFTPNREIRWYQSPKAHATVVVDNGLQGRAVAVTRNRFDSDVKFVGIRTVPVAYVEKDDDGVDVEKVAELYPGVRMERCMALTREYMFDAFAVRSGEAHVYDWIAHPFGSAEPDDPSAWKATTDLDRSLHDTAAGMAFDFGDQRVLEAGGGAWSLSVVQTAFSTNVDGTAMGPEWYGRRVGVRVSMLGEEGTRVFHARKPLLRSMTPDEREIVEAEKDPYRLRDRTEKYNKVDSEITELEVLPADAKALKPGEARAIEARKEPFKPVGVVSEKIPETGGVSLVVERHASNTLFAALHEPFEGGRWRLGEFRRLAQTADALAAAVKGRDGSPVNDRLLLRTGEEAGKPVTLDGDGESYTFSDFVLVRIGGDAVRVSGPLTAMKVKVDGMPKLVVNGVEKKAKVSGGIMSY